MPKRDNFTNSSAENKSNPYLEITVAPSINGKTGNARLGCLRINGHLTAWNIESYNISVTLSAGLGCDSDITFNFTCPKVTN